MKILGCDPGKDSDPFFIVGVEVLNGKIYIRAARYWIHTDYSIVEEQIVRLYKRHNFDLIVVEKNAAGNPVADSLENRYELPIARVFTTNKLKEQKSDTMDKSVMVNWMVRASQIQGEKEPVLIFPESDNPYLKELIRQWRIFGEYHKDKYEAPAGEHDDGVMALMLACFKAKNYLVRQEPVVLSKSYSKLRDNAVNKGLLPDGTKPHAGAKLSIYYPK